MPAALLFLSPFYADYAISLRHAISFDYIFIIDIFIISPLPLFSLIFRHDIDATYCRYAATPPLFSQSFRCLSPFRFILFHF
jgi:hypothetical protein